MHFAVGLAVFVSAIAIASAELKCSLNVEENTIFKEFSKMDNDCIKEMKNQITKEIAASYQYLKFAAHFSRDTVNRPGLAKFFFNAAKEEREHGIHLMEYLSMRGQLTTGVRSLFNPTTQISTAENTKTWSVAEALKDALELETNVTESIRGVILSCENENFNDYHLVDYLTGVFLEEQYKGQRDLAGKLSTLMKMEQKYKGGLAEFLFDKEL